MFPVQIQKIKEKHEKDRSLKKKIRQSPKDYTELVIENQKIVSFRNRIYTSRIADAGTQLVPSLFVSSWCNHNVQNHRSYHVLGICRSARKYKEKATLHPVCRGAISVVVIGLKKSEDTTGLNPAEEPGWSYPTTTTSMTW